MFVVVVMGIDGNRLGILAAQRLPGEDDGARIDVVRVHAGSQVGGVDDLADPALVDALLAQIRRERNRRLVHTVAADDEVAARQLFREAPQVHA